MPRKKENSELPPVTQPDPLAHQLGNDRMGGNVDPNLEPAGHEGGGGGAKDGAAEQAAKAAAQNVTVVPNPAGNSNATAQLRDKASPEPAIPLEGVTINSSNQDFFTAVYKWLDDDIAAKEKQLEGKKADYDSKKWAYGKNINKLEDTLTGRKQLKAEMERIEQIVTSDEKYGDDLLLLANVVYNEAASVAGAQTAIAYAYLNRTGGTIREPKNSQEISHYKDLDERWDGYSVLTDKQKKGKTAKEQNDMIYASQFTFIKDFPSCVEAAKTRIDDATPAENDPTNGATHWVSPEGLEKGARADYYERDYNDITTQFPIWARDPQYLKDNPEEAKLHWDADKYSEFALDGVPGEKFLFYTGVY